MIKKIQEFMSISSDEFKTILAGYHLNGWKSIQISYDGAGDSGSVEEIQLYNSDEGPYGHYEQLEGEEYTKIEDAFYRLFDQSMGDWVNNDGGYGMLTINLEDGSYTNEVNYRTIEMDTIEGFLSEL
jgi:hypothetical protein